MADLLMAHEATPAEWPDVAGVPDHVWARLETWTAYRFAARQVVWTVAGPGDWRPPLAPVVSLAAEAWADGWQAVTLQDGPAGYSLGARHYRITATVGAGPVPEPVQEAAKRLAAYLAHEPAGVPGASSYGVTMGQLGENFRRSPQWLARAMEWSGAADLLRPYRRA